MAYNRKQLKKDGKKILKKSYVLIMALCFITAFIGADFFGSIDSASSIISDSVLYANSNSVNNNSNKLTDVLYDIAVGNIGEAKQSAQQSLEQNQKKDITILGINFGHSRGVMADIVNRFSSGSIIISIFLTIRGFVGSNNTAVIIFDILLLLIYSFVWIFTVNLFRAGFRRVILELKNYNKSHFFRVIHIYRKKHIVSSAKTMLLVRIYQTLWDFTIIGGFIKSYSYMLVPYIVAENPDIPPNNAITLSRKMMNGHKWECFILDLSFIGWELLNIPTLGILKVLFIIPYRECTHCEYYAYLRGLAQENKLENIAYLNDTYLYEKPSKETLQQAYSDIIELSKTPDEPVVERKGFAKFMANVFGVISSYNKSEQAYINNLEKHSKLQLFENVINGSIYPERLNPVPNKEKKRPISYLHYMRHYSVYSIIIMFFIICIVGWIWEVCLHMMVEGGFVNRGFLHGPWLPIYGSGSILILVLLNKFRKNGFIEFISAVILCGIVEYFTAVILEMNNGGKNWWSYSGYFMNLNARICLEGLLVFGIGGCVIVYILAPIIDNQIRKLPLKTSITICIILGILFTADVAYSVISPNTGEGVSENSSISEVVTEAHTSNNN